MPVPIRVHVYVKNTMPTATERKHFVNNEQSAHHDNQAGQKNPQKNKKPTHLEQQTLIFDKVS